MKNRIVPLAVALGLTAFGGIAAASGWSREGTDPSTTSAQHRDFRGHRLDRLATVLKLTDDQKAQIKGIYAAERPVMKPLFQAVGQARRDLRAVVGQSATFDETAVRALAQKQAQAQVELTVERARAHSKVLAVLTPDQRNLLKSLRPLLARRGGRRGGGAF